MTRRCGAKFLHLRAHDLSLRLQIQPSGVNKFAPGNRVEKNIVVGALAKLRAGITIAARRQSFRVPPEKSLYGCRPGFGQADVNKNRFFVHSDISDNIPVWARRMKFPFGMMTIHAGEFKNTLSAARRT